MKINNLLKLDPFKINSKKKSKVFLENIKSLTIHHYKLCNKYRKVVKNLKFKITNNSKLEAFPMLPVRLFKKYDFLSTPTNKIV